MKDTDDHMLLMFCDPDCWNAQIGLWRRYKGERPRVEWYEPIELEAFPEGHAVTAETLEREQKGLAIRKRLKEERAKANAKKAKNAKGKAKGKGKGKGKA